MTADRRDATLRAARRLTWAIAAAMAFQAVVGLAAPGLYRDIAWIKAAWFGNDIVTLLVAVPMLPAGMAMARGGSTRGLLLWCAALGYAVYNYGYYLFGARIAVHFPLFVALFVAPVWTLALLLSTVDVDAVARSFAARTPVRSVSTYMLFTGIGLGMAWLAQWAGLVFAGTVPNIGEDPFALVAAMDLSFVVPTMIVGGVLLWRRRPWGYFLGAIMNVKGATYTLVLTIGSIVAGMRGIPGSFEQAPIWAVWTLAGVAASYALLSRAGRS